MFSKPCLETLPCQILQTPSAGHCLDTLGKSLRTGGNSNRCNPRTAIQDVSVRILFPFFLNELKKSLTNTTHTNQVNFLLFISTIRLYNSRSKLIFVSFVTRIPSKYQGKKNCRKLTKRWAKIDLKITKKKPSCVFWGAVP